MLKIICATAVAVAFSVGTASAIDVHMCKEDAARLCPTVKPGGGRVAKCLKEHENEVSIGCAKEIKKLKS